MEKIKLSSKMKEVPIDRDSYKIWVLCACPECTKEFITKFEQTNNTSMNNLFGLKPLPEELTCPYCGIKKEVYAEIIVNADSKYLADKG